MVVVVVESDEMLIEAAPQIDAAPQCRVNERGVLLPLSRLRAASSRVGINVNVKVFSVIFDPKLQSATLSRRTD